MRSELATLFTLGLLFSFLLAVVVGLMLFAGVFRLAVVVAIVVGIDFVML